MYQSHLRLTAKGTLGSAAGGVEQFSFGLAIVGSQGSANTANLSEQADDYASDLVAFFARPASYIPTHARLTEVKVAVIGPDGKYQGAPQIRPVGQNGAAPNIANIGVYPPQVAIAVSLVTARYGPTGKGRFYLPTALPMSTADYLVPDGDAQSLRGSVVTLLNDLNNEDGGDELGTTVAVASTKGYNSPVTGVRVGRALDTMRSRRRSLTESYTSVTNLA